MSVCLSILHFIFYPSIVPKFQAWDRRKKIKPYLETQAYNMNISGNTYSKTWSYLSLGKQQTIILCGFEMQSYTIKDNIKCEHFKRQS
jgi:hypothetical protein